MLRNVEFPFWAAKAFVRLHSTSMLIIEPIDLSIGSIAQIKHDAESLARRSLQVDPDIFGVLRCFGLLKHRCKTTGNLASVEVVYRTPDGMRLPTNFETPTFRLTYVVIQPGIGICTATQTGKVQYYRSGT